MVPQLSVHIMETSAPCERYGRLSVFRLDSSSPEAATRSISTYGHRCRNRGCSRTSFIDVNAVPSQPALFATSTISG